MQPPSLSSLAVTGRDDIGLHGVVSRICGVTLEHRALVKSADRPIAVVAADAKDDRALAVEMQRWCERRG